MVHQLAVNYPQWSPCKIFSCIFFVYFVLLLRSCQPKGAKGHQVPAPPNHSSIQSVSSSRDLRCVLEMCRYLGPYASNQPVLVWKLVRLGKFLLSEVGIYGVEVPLERGEVGIRFTWRFLGPYRPYAMTSSLCIVGDQSNCVVPWTYYKWTFIDALMNSCTCHCQKCHKSISDMLSLFDPHDCHRQLAGRGIWT